MNGKMIDKGKPHAPFSPFRPSFPLRGAALQTILASSRIRTWGPNPMVDAARSRIIDAGDGVRLLGYASPRSDPPKKGWVILLHGWEGSADSSYILSTGRTLYRRGYSIFRLNLRDHGKSHHLNPGLFFATLIDEVFEAVAQVARMADPGPVFLAGFSLGGNFALRIARRCEERPIQNLAHVFSVSPVLDPLRATDAIDEKRFVRKYFLKKWRRSLSRKQTLFPELYDFSEALEMASIRGITDLLLSRYSHFQDARDYFSRYSLVGDALKSIPVPATIVTARDDPIIPVEDFFRLDLNPQTRLVIHPHGGHNGFVEGPALRSWVDLAMTTAFGSESDRREREGGNG